MIIYTPIINQNQCNNLIVHIDRFKYNFDQSIN